MFFSFSQGKPKAQNLITQAVFSQRRSFYIFVPNQDPHFFFHVFFFRNGFTVNNPAQTPDSYKT